MSQRFFVNYRRKDDPHAAGRLFEALESAFPGEVFMDSDERGIAPGEDFVEALQKAIASSENVMVVIGANWLSLKDDQDRRRLDNPHDFVRIEIEAALNQGKRVIPVLMNGVQMPSQKELPASMRKLAVLNAVEIRPNRFKADADLLIKALGGASGNAVPVAPAHPTTADEALRTLERTRWNALGDKPSIENLRSFVKQFPNGVYLPVAQIRLEELAWESLPRLPKVEQLKSFLAEFPNGAHADRALELLKKHKDYGGKIVERFIIHFMFVGGFFVGLAIVVSSALYPRGVTSDFARTMFALLVGVPPIWLFIWRRRRWRRALERPNG